MLNGEVASFLSRREAFIQVDTLLLPSPPFSNTLLMVRQNLYRSSYSAIHTPRQICRPYCHHSHIAGAESPTLPECPAEEVNSILLDKDAHFSKRRHGGDLAASMIAKKSPDRSLPMHSWPTCPLDRSSSLRSRLRRDSLGAYLEPYVADWSLTFYFCVEWHVPWFKLQQRGPRPKPEYPY